MQSARGSTAKRTMHATNRIQFVRLRAGMGAPTLLAHRVCCHPHEGEAAEDVKDQRSRDEQQQQEAQNRAAQEGHVDKVLSQESEP